MGTRERLAPKPPLRPALFVSRAHSSQRRQHLTQSVNALILPGPSTAQTRLFHPST